MVVVGGAAAAGAWQLGLIGDSVDEPGGTNLAAPSDGTIPQTVDYVLAIDPAVTDDEVTRTLVETAVQPGGTPFDSVSSGLAQFQATTGIEPNRIEQAVVFGRMEQSRPAVAMELQLADQASPRSVAETVTPDSVEQTTYAGTTVYQAGKARPDGVEQWVTSPAEGVVIVGYAPAVKDALDVRNGDTAAWDGRLRERFESMGADPIRLATRLPAEQFGADGLGRADVLTASYGAAGSAVSVQSTVYTPDPETASAIANNVDGTIGPLTEDLRDSNQFSSGADALAQTTVQREGSTVRIEMAADPESVGTLTSVLLQTGGFLQTNPTVVTETNTPAPTADRIAVVNTVGSNIENESVGTVSMTVKLAPGSGPIDVTETTVQWVGSSGTYVLVADGVGGGDGQFTIEAIRDDDNSIQSSGTLNSPEDRAQLVFSPGDGFGARLDAGTQGQLTFTTESGTTTTATIVVPDSLAGKDAVAL
ncbi:hypothetical protein Hrd1104_04670 [Halorhabdus sp. CBA1104]|nr:hypothetical protein Hrd1104_04670 [Halorhabdus sp. CBA1104]